MIEFILIVEFFLLILIPYVEASMLKKGKKVEWFEAAKHSFHLIKNSLREAPLLINPYYNKEFIIFPFYSTRTIFAVLLYKNHEENEQPIEFFSRALRDAELKYSIMEKHAYALIKGLKSFQYYVLHSKIIVFFII